MAEDLAETVIDLEVRIAYQDRLIRELDALVRTFGTRLDAAERDLRQLREAVAPPSPTNERPPHY
jgi:uncharacterized coiled-coil protein SlyX